MNLGVFAFFENHYNKERQALKEQLDLIVHADKIGLEEAWLSEHHFNPFSVAGPIMPLMGYAVGATKNIKIGSAAVLLPYHNPLHVAEAISALDTLSNERLLFGIAKGAFPMDDKHFKSSPETNTEVMREAMEVIEKLLKEEKVSFTGKYFTFDEAQLVPKPSRDIPKYFATFGSLKSIEYAVKYNYGLLLSQNATKESIKECIDIYTSLAGKKPDVKVLRMLYINEDEGKAIEEGNQASARFSHAMRAIKNGKEFTPLREKIFDTFSMTECGIVGTPTHCKEQLKIYEDMGVDGIMVRAAGKNLQENKTFLEILRSL